MPYTVSVKSGLGRDFKSSVCLRCQIWVGQGLQVKLMPWVLSLSYAGTSGRVYALSAKSGFGRDFRCAESGWGRFDDQHKKLFLILNNTIPKSV